MSSTPAASFLTFVAGLAAAVSWGQLSVPSVPSPALDSRACHCHCECQQPQGRDWLSLLVFGIAVCGQLTLALSNWLCGRRAVAPRGRLVLADR